jgi:hypothetical protein
MTEITGKTWLGATNALSEKLEQLGGAEYFARVIEKPLEEWHHDCHRVSLAIVRTGVLGSKARVARGTCAHVGGQHSWIAVTGDCYDAYSPIVDPTLWTYRADVPRLLVTSLYAFGHRPHGAGRIFEWGQPTCGDGEPISLTPSEPLSPLARDFLALLGPLDLRGWMILASEAPVEDWPAGEILAAMDDTPVLRALVPIDRLGMLTERNPGGLYR